MLLVFPGHRAEGLLGTGLLCASQKKNLRTETGIASGDLIKF